MYYYVFQTFNEEYFEKYKIKNHKKGKCLLRYCNQTLFIIAEIWLLNTSNNRDILKYNLTVLYLVFQS